MPITVNDKVEDIFHELESTIIVEFTNTAYWVTPIIKFSNKLMFCLDGSKCFNPRNITAHKIFHEIIRLKKIFKTPKTNSSYDPF